MCVCVCVYICVCVCVCVCVFVCMKVMASIDMRVGGSQESNIEKRKKKK